LYPAGYNAVETFGNANYKTLVISVGATDNADARAGFSQYGPWVKVYAPGAQILTTVRAADPCPRVGVAADRLCNKNGTSFAAPLVAGVARLLRASRNAAPIAIISDSLTTTLDNTGNTAPDNSPIQRLNAFKAIIQASAVTCNACPDAPQVSVNGNTVLSGLPNAPRNGNQPRSAHGASIPLENATSYDISYSVTGSSWDSCRAAAGFFDCFSVTISAKRFWEVAGRNNTPASANANFRLVYQDGGVARGPAAIQAVNGAANPNVQAFNTTNFLNLVVDTGGGNAAPDTRWPSWGSLVIRDITPH
jgi:hypothetical protein